MKSQTVTSILALLAFVLSVAVSAYVFYQSKTEDPSPINPVVILDYLELSQVVTDTSSSEEEKALKLQLAAIQLDELQSAGYIVLDSNGGVVRAPEELVIKAADLGIK